MPEDRNWFGERLHFHLDPYLALTSDHIDELFAHFELLRRWNPKINLTSVRSSEEIVLRHYCESLFFAAVLKDIQCGTSFADVGSGAGFPGVPLAIYRPDDQVTLIESHQRKAVFLRESTRSLRNVHVLANRAEDVTVKFDCIVSRAVAPEDVLKLLPKLAPRLAIFLGSTDFARVKGDPHIAWEDPIQMPWGDRRLVAIGSTWNAED